MDEQFRFAVLGPVRAWRSSREIELGPPQQRLVLAALLLAEGSQVVSGELVEAVWGCEAPASAFGVLRTYIHRLRKALRPAGDAGASVIRSTANGYQLRTSPQALDLSSFRELLAQAEQARCAGDIKGVAGFLREALSLWRGAALAGARGDYAQAQRQRLDGLRMSAQADRIAAELSLGDHSTAAAELSRLVCEHPLDERFRELLMLALYLSGRQAAALDTYREARILLAKELGVDPGPALRTMYQRILRADTTLIASAVGTAPAQAHVPSAPHPVPAGALTVPAQLPPGFTTFVGRDAELAELTESALGGTAVVSAISGTAGVGKTAFAVHWARQVADRFPDGQLYLNLRGFDPVGLPVSPEHALRNALESLGADARKLPQDIDSLAATFRTLLTGKRVLLLLDNVRDASQVRPLLPGAPGCLALVTSRSRLSGLVALDGAHPVDLAVLSVPEARELLARRLKPGQAEAEPRAVEEIISRCARLPLALAVTAARAATRPTLSLTAIAAELRESADGLDAFHDGDTAADIRAVFSWSYQALTPQAARLFRFLALHPGPDITLPATASLVALPLPHTRQLLTELVQAHLLEEHIPGRYTSHDLLRTYATELTHTFDSPRGAQAARHRILDHYLHSAREALTLTGERALISIAPAAEGVRAEAFGTDTDKATAWFTAEQAVLLAAAEQAYAHHYDVHTWQLAWAVANHLHWRGLWQEHEAVHHTAMAAARRLGDLTAQAHIHHGLIVVTTARDRNDEARVHAERAIELFTDLNDMQACAECYRALSRVAEQQGDPETALDAALRYLALKQTYADRDRDTDDIRGRRATAAAFNMVGWSHSQLGQHEQALDHCRQALALCQELECSTGVAETWGNIGYAHLHLGQYEEAVAAYRNAVDASRRGDFHWKTAEALMRLGDAHLGAGRPDAARAAWVGGAGHQGAARRRRDRRQRTTPHQNASALRSEWLRHPRPGAAPEPRGREHALTRVDALAIYLDVIGGARVGHESAYPEEFLRDAVLLYSAAGARNHRMDQENSQGAGTPRRWVRLPAGDGCPRRRRAGVGRGRADPR
ncbi:BTAD domain-containing putative transcriptional regulator [[Kitasatospora] papulosa]|uniref:AfsR/SARP family transcriptional regulator n=1 Tax=[Kitasatospora] papulosa TaxID=1464011 RepID=UPI0036CA13E7